MLFRSIYNKKTLEAIDWLTKKSWLIPYSTRVNSLTNYQHTEAFEDDLVVTDLVEDPSIITPKDIQKIRNIAQNEPLLLNQIVAADESTSVIVATIHPPEKDPLEIPEVANHVRNLMKEFNTLYPGYNTHLSG